MDKNEYGTPPHIFEYWNSIYHFTLDACASKTNAKCKKFYTKENSCLDKSWKGETVWINPPYSPRALQDAFIAKAVSESRHAFICMLIPAVTGCKSFHKYLYNKPGITIKFLEGRISFIGEDGKPCKSPRQDSMIVLMGMDRL